MAWVAGLVSVTFRQLSCEQIVDRCSRAGLSAIEWGGDVHVPPGDLDRAKTVARMSQDAGLTVAAYGSYYRAGVTERSVWNAVLASALALQAPHIRVWAGQTGSTQSDDAGFATVVGDLQRIVDDAASNGIGVDLEYHGGTLTDTPASTVRLMDAVGRERLRTYWQPRVGQTPDTHLNDIAILGVGRIGNVHVFHWWPDGRSRLPLRHAETNWAGYLGAIGTHRAPRYAMLEFVPGDDPETLNAEETSLRRIIDSGSVNGTDGSA
jgi:3-dehydroshikimate dehydratase